MAIRHHDLDPEEVARQHALDRSWRAAQEGLMDPKFRAYVEASIVRVNTSDATPITAEEFLAQAEHPAD